MKLSFGLQAAEATPFKIRHNDSNAVYLLSRQLQSIFLEIPDHRPIVFVCIGTDRSTGDALGPLVGSKLKKYTYSDIFVSGTLDEPVHAVNLGDSLRDVQRDYFNPYIVGVDACLGQLTSVGSVQLGLGPLKPGAGVNKELPPVGDIHLTGIVNVGGFMEYFVLQNTRLSLVMNMADMMAKSIYAALINAKRIAVFAKPSSSPVPRFDQ
ncbi:MAG: spore protease YyaC [Cohnella sp.]|uniref:spore protease YyaC n=1 Tax=Paenibacillus cymbidii TaxID=1639034 RepID=UPI0010800028|nr:spore protease YyaC [Paenibacillus cymbidii]MBO9599099.1 spore protease YyaC [Cohnella sp.]